MKIFKKITSKIIYKINEFFICIFTETLLRDNIQQLLFGVFERMLSDNFEIQKKLWKVCNVRPVDMDTHWATIPNSIREYRMMRATIEAAEFVHNNIPHIEGKSDSFETMYYALKEVDIDGLFMEFGVFSGTTIKYIAENVKKNIIVHGFDSFEGLPEIWGDAPKGSFNSKGTIPIVPKNVLIHKGFFDKTIDIFVNEYRDNAAFIHIDSDLYSSASTILKKLSDRIVKGTVIVFDEFFNYPYWKDHEYRAFMEFIDESKHDFKYIAYSDRGYSVAVKIIS